MLSTSRAPRSPRSPWAKTLATATVGLLMAALAPGAGAATTPSVTLRTLTKRVDGKLSVPQGLPLRFKTLVHNPGDVAVIVEVELSVEQVATGELVPFFYWKGSVGPGLTVPLRSAVTPSQWFVQKGVYRVLRTNGVGGALRFGVTRSPFAVPRFADVTESLGLMTDHGADVQCDNYAAGAAWGDIDGDADLDLFLPHQTKAAQLWVNDAGSFADEAAARGATNGALGLGAVFADYDNDGDQDLYVVNDGPNRLLDNDGTGHFSDVAPAAGVAEAGPGSSASWGDYDSDGYLDLYVTNWTRCGGQTYTYFADTLYHNEGDGTFTDQTALLNATGTTMGAGFEAAWFDYDNDGDQDLYLANDLGGPKRIYPNVLWRNDGENPDTHEWVFTNVSTESGTGLGMNTMGIALGDYDRDMDLDIGLSNIDETALMRNNGDGTFDDVAAYARVARPIQRVRERSITWGQAFFDFNNDGWEDLYVAGGSLAQELMPEPQPNALFVNGHNGRFLDLSAPSRADDDGISRGIAFADYDRDGKMDLYVVNQGGQPHLLHNVAPLSGSHWLEVDTVGTTSARDGCGARVVAVLNWKTKLLREVYCGSISLASGSDSTVHFGLGSATKIAKLKITWPSGTVQTLTDVAADQLLTVEEPAQ